MHPRDRIRLYRPDRSNLDQFRWDNFRRAILAAGYEPLAMIEPGDAILIRHRQTGQLAAYVGGARRSVNQRKAAAALAELTQTSK